MKLFMFYPNDYCRMYVLVENLEELQARADELFLEYMKRDYLDIILDIDEINDKKQYFLRGLEVSKELINGIAIDSHY